MDVQSGKKVMGTRKSDGTFFSFRIAMKCFMFYCVFENAYDVCARCACIYDYISHIYFVLLPHRKAANQSTPESGTMHAHFLSHELNAIALEKREMR